MIKIFLFIALSIQQESNVSLHVETASFDRFKDKLLPQIFPSLQDLDIDLEIDLGTIKVHEIKSHLDPIDPQNIQFHQTDEDSIHIDVVNIKFNLDIAAEIKKYIHTSGNINVIGQIDFMSIFLDFQELKKDDPKPQIDLKSSDIKYNAKDFKFKLDFENLPSWLVDWVVNLIKEKLLDQIIPQVVQTINQTASVQVNQQLEDIYPLQFNLGILDLGINTGLVDKPDFKGNRFNFDIDGTFFKVQNSRINQGVIKVNDNVKAIELQIGQKAFTSALDLIIFQKFEIKGYEYDIYFEAIKSDNYFLITEDGLFINDLEFKIYVKDYKFLYTLDTKLDLKIALSSITLEQIVLDIVEFNLDQFKCNSTSKILRNVTRYTQIFVEEFIKTKKQFTLPLPKVELPYNLQVGDITATFQKEKMQIDVSFIF